MKSIIISYILLFTLYPNSVTYSQITDPGNIVQRVILIGDAGNPKLDYKEPVLKTLELYADSLNEITKVIFLGDNIYPQGLTDENDGERELYENKIQEQIDAVIRSGAEGYFIPGNHDWDKGSEKGIEFIKRQEEFVNKFNSEGIRFLPENGCPGPEYVDVDSTIRIIFLDTQWWFQQDNLKIANDNNCNCKTRDEVVEKLNEIIAASNNRSILICGHHPLKSYGEHGGYFGILTHLFPFRSLNSALWIPLPVIGSLYPLSRIWGISSQDLTSSEYQNFIAKIEEVLDKHNNIFYASGHDHVIQILKAKQNNTYIISGAGIFGETSENLSDGDDLFFGTKEAGFVILDFYSTGAIVLRVISVLNEEVNSKVSFLKQFLKN